MNRIASSSTIPNQRGLGSRSEQVFGEIVTLNPIQLNFYDCYFLLRL